VWAGQSPNNPGHGVILIVRRPGGSGRLAGGAAPTLTLLAPPALAGPLHIVRVDGADLIVANPGGQEFRFNPVAGAIE
ncbi:MAG TPA: hypothetical protein VFJ71_08120, partial [Candidatus Limnocylindrales bacterium]|nr:hypothetical protein [Candidatus Limnocylindrales bacterium]